MNKEKLKEIFIEEASEIIEKLDIEIINFEENPSDKNLLNELFRGVHTLKGSANSFGFKRLGEFVHGFEDVLDHYRTSDEIPGRAVIDVFLDAVDVIKEVFDYEINDNQGVPSKYAPCKEAFASLINGKEESANIPNESEEIKDLSSEFGGEINNETIKNSAKDKKKITNPNLSQEELEYLASLDELEILIKIVLNMDDDLYLRGQDYSVFLRLLASEGEILSSHWNVNNIPNLEDLDPQTNYINEVVIYLKTKNELSEIEEIFEYVEDHEKSVEQIFEEIDDVELDFGELNSELGVKSADTSDTSSEEILETKRDKPTQNIDSKNSDKSEETPKKSEQIQAAQSNQNSYQQRSFVKIDTLKLDELFDSVGELVIAQNFLAENEKIKSIKDENVLKTLETLSKITRLIQNRVMSLRMVPIRDTFEKMKRVVRDSSRKVNKEVKLIISGEDTEIDKTMVDALSDPLIHIIRNAIDHGLEANADDRVKASKSVEGEVGLRAYHKGGNIVIEISDDGRGINRDKVYSKALERGLISPNDELNDSQIYALIMQAGFSTADKISDISGRGVGLDVVRNSIEELRGKVEIDSKVGIGTKFCILLPLTLAIIDGMLVKSSGETFIIPTLSIIESFRPHKEIVHTAQGEGEFVNLREELLPIIRLNRILELDDNNPKAWESTLVCAENENGRFAILVDELVGRQQVVIKTLGKTLSHLKEVSGGAVLGNGQIALILNVEGLYH